MNKDLALFFFNEAANRLAFLMVEYSFSPPRLEVDDRINFATVIFEAKNLAIECILDEREQDLTCKIARICDGKVASSYAVDDNGVRVREDLFRLLLARGVRERIWTHVGNLELRDRIPIFFADIARTLERHARDILQDSATVFE